MTSLKTRSGFIPFILLINVFSCLLVSIPTLSKAQTDSIAIVNDTNRTSLESEIWYSAEDSMRFDLKAKKIYLYGKAKVIYETMQLEADYMEFSFSDNLVYARGTIDSSGNVVGKPLFNDGSEELTASEIWYNFETKKGIIKDVRTQQGEGFVHMGVSKKMANDEIHLEDGKYTTCDLDDPHYYFHLTRAIVIPDDKIVSGPVNLVIAGIPTPLALPFGFFPNKQREARGIIIPQYGESQELGFFLLNGGYYFPLGKNGKGDMQVLGDIYSRGSWGAKTITRYKNRYHYSGNLSLSFTELRFSDPEYPDFSIDRNFFVRWRHDQDAKAHPYRRFNASVNAGTRNNFRNNFNTYSQDYLSNTFQSNIGFSYTIPNKPMNFTVNLRHNQNTLTGLVNLTLPEFNFNVNRIYPFAKLNKSGKRRFYENIGFTYNTNMRNDLSVQDTLFREQYFNSLPGRMRNGMRHTANLTTTFKLFNQKVSFNPAINYIERWYLQTIEKSWDAVNDTTVIDTLSGFRRIGEYSFSSSMTMKLYAMFTASKGKRGTKVRHVSTHSVNFSYRPDFGSDVYGYFGVDSSYSSYSPFDIGIYGKPSSGKSGMITYNMINNIEMKFKPIRSDSGNVFKKVVLIENFTIFTGYDLLKDSLNFSNIVFSGRTRIWKNLGLLYTGSMDPYVYDNGVKQDVLMASNGNGLGRFTTNQFALTWSLRSKNKTPNKARENLSEEEKEELERNSWAYIDFTLPWSLNINYNVNANRFFMNGRDTITYTQSLVFSGDLRLTENWKIGFNSGYDFVAEDFTYTEINLYRDLHCWEMSFNWIPFGFRKSYMIQINVKASMLQDLKLTRRRAWFDNL